MEENIKSVSPAPLSTETHHRKNWKSYFWEFLMLFLAVFCGFLAENFREYQVERETEHQFIQSYVEDLKTDTAAITQILAYRNLKMERMDSLLLLMSTGQIKGHENALYFFGRILIRSYRFQNNDRTITQLKNSGSLRLIRNEQAADSMMAYQKLVEYIYFNPEDDRIERRAADPILSRMFDPFVLNKMISTNGIDRPLGNPPLRSYDPAVQQDLAYYVNQIRGSNVMIEGRLSTLNDKAKNMISFLQKEYQLK